jgi:penicillin-binding protein 2
MMAFKERSWVVISIIIIIGLVFIIRLFFLQVATDYWAEKATSITEKKITTFPARGLIYDRNRRLMVANKAIYDLMVLPADVKENGKDSIDISRLLGISTKEYHQSLEKARNYSAYKPSTFVEQIPAEQFGYIADQLYKYPEFIPVPRTLRSFPIPIAPHTIGYISEVSPRQIEQNPYYKSGDYIGASGIEKAYEKDLRGKRGKRYIVVDVHNKEIESYKNGAFDEAAISGDNLVLSIDAALQEYGELLLKNKKGSIVAIEPQTGEVLALVSSPGYNPNLLVGRDRSKNYKLLAANDSLGPLFNRTINAQYRPGSVFKIVEALIALEEGVIKPETRIRCNRGIINCHGAHTNDDLRNAIIHSCNPYFRDVYRRLIQRGEFNSIYKDSEAGLKKWRKRVMYFGFGAPLGIDLEGEKGGQVPGVDLYDKWYGNGRWAFSTIYSNSIGEGELLVVPLQMANLAAIIANKGYYYIPHIVKSIGDKNAIRPEYTKKHETMIASEHFELVQDAMEAVVNKTGGTARRARSKDIVISGKTGTVQNGDFPDHSVFIAFAPKVNPKIAIAVYVEYAGFGGTWAAPIASLMIEKYLKGEITNHRKEKRILDFKNLYITKTKK